MTDSGEKTPLESKETVREGEREKCAPDGHMNSERVKTGSEKKDFGRGVVVDYPFRMVVAVLRRGPVARSCIDKPNRRRLELDGDGDGDGDG